MEDYEKKILDAIEQGVKSESQMVLGALNAEIERMHDEKLSLFQQSLKRETEHYLEKELNDLRVAAANQKSQVKFDYMQQLLNLRSGYMKQMVEEVKEKIRSFVNSPNYEDYLRKNLEKTPYSSNGFFYVREQDVRLMQSLLQEKDYSNEVKTAYFTFGGFRYVDEQQAVEYSCELIEKLEESLDWFRGNSGFILEGEK